MQVQDSLDRCDLLVDTRHKKIRSVYTGNQLTGFYMKTALALKGLNLCRNYKFILC